MESRLIQQKRGLMGKIPEIKAALSALDFIESSDEKELSTRFELSDALYVRAKVLKTGKVLLWLGANVMVEYTSDEAKGLLTTNLTVRYVLALSLTLSVSLALSSPPCRAPANRGLASHPHLPHPLPPPHPFLPRPAQNAEKTLASLDVDLVFLKDQITVSEVNIARMHNQKVTLAQQAKAEAEKEAAAAAAGSRKGGK